VCVVSADAAAHACPMCGYHPGKVNTDEGKLPRRYRKAYRFLQANISEPDLSIDDLAEAAGVTARALQMAWKKHLGCSPSSTIRRQRAERIRCEIVASGKPIMQCGEQFGVFSRAALNALFKSEFGCAPSVLRAPMQQDAT
jgi:transcriptional regulator GlxA family with amidase domain